jgi:hypothetical protein
MITKVKIINKINIIAMMQSTTILLIAICFQRRDQGTTKRH